MAIPTAFPSLEEVFNTLNVNMGKEQNESEEDGAKETKILAEMEDVSKHICRLCLDTVPTGDAEAIEETKKEKLKLLLINIDFDISDNVVACNRCLEKLQECFNFKSACSSSDNCIIPFVNVDIKVDIENAFQEETSVENVKLESTCQLCMLPIEDEFFNYTNDSIDGVVLKDMIRNCLPEVDLNSVQELLICNRCLNNTKKYNEFMKMCHEVEQRIQNYHQVMTSYGKVVLQDVLRFKNCDILSEPMIKNEGPVPIKCEEIDIKHELDVESAESGNCNISGMNNVPMWKGQIGKPGSKQDKPHRYFCQKCPYSAYRYGTFMIHMHTHTDNKIHKCFLCSFVTNAKLLLSRHMKTHKGFTKTYGCCECPYETNDRYELTRHFIKHKDDSEVVMHQCKNCSFSTKFKRKLAHHILKHDKPEEFLTRRGEKDMFKCEKCEYQTRYKKSLKLHVLAHEATFKHECEMCGYRSNNHPNFKRHMLTHIEEKLYSCDQCMYCTNIMRNLLSHKQVHVRDSERVTLQCDKCDFQTKSKGSLKDHKLVHNPKQPTFKCDHCGYNTRKRTRLNQHLVTHMGLQEAVVYCCATCNFKTKYKHSLLNHVHRCLKRKKKNDNNKNKKISFQPTNNVT